MVSRTHQVLFLVTAAIFSNFRCGLKLMYLARILKPQLGLFTKQSVNMCPRGTRKYYPKSI